MIPVLFDTCIVIDLLEKREPFFEDAYSLMLAVANHQIRGCLSANSVLDTYYILHRANHSNEKTREAVKTLCSLFTVVNTTSSDCEKALLSEIADYEDAVMVETAIREGISTIVTRNTKDFEKAKLEIVTPAVLAARLR